MSEVRNAWLFRKYGVGSKYHVADVNGRCYLCDCMASDRLSNRIREFKKPMRKGQTFSLRGYRS